MRILIVGGTGLLGAELKQVWHDDDQVLCIGYPDIDIRDPQGTRQLVCDFGPGIAEGRARDTRCASCYHG